MRAILLHGIGAGSSPRAGRRHLVVAAHHRPVGLIPASGETTHTRPARRPPRTAHPRERGDDHGRGHTINPREGSSPRAGRRRPQGVSAAQVVRLIPASGETTGTWSRCASRRAAHPRERGDDSAPALGLRSAGGSSPRAGRRLGARLGLAVGGRLIPASGETTRPVRRGQGRREAHPRERGDDARVAAQAQADAGSSPRAGRRPRIPPPKLLDQGLIPASGETTTAAPSEPAAHAGSSPRAGRRPGAGRGQRRRGRLIPASGETTAHPAAEAVGSGAHPRERGDDASDRSTPTGRQGSSPRAGRRPRPASRSLSERRLIPASGETTAPTPSSTGSSPAHPRERGDDHVRTCHSTVTPGSSPRAGRRPAGRTRPCRRRGLIPASGETTPLGRRCPTSPGAHPRERGDDTATCHDVIGDPGSSPRAGRRHHVSQRRQNVVGLIPASGETTMRSRRRNG